MRGHWLFGGALIVLVAAGGCMSSAGGIAPSTTPITDSMVVTEIGPASGSSWGANILGIPIGEAGLQVAVRRALESSGGDALTEVIVDNKIYYLYLATIFETKVQGTAVTITKKSP